MEQLPRVWVTGMWGFEPEEAGYVGFTLEAPRKKYIRECLPGDLMMIIGQRSEYTAERDVGRVLGIVELEPTPISDTERISGKAWKEKVDRGWRDRWTFAMPAVRAWRTRQEVKAKYVAPITCSANNARVIGSNTLLLQPEEVERLMRFPLRKVGLFGQPDWLPDNELAPEVPALTAVSHGPPPHIGTSTHTTVDSDNQLYLMELTGELNGVLPQVDHRKSRVLKIGRSNDETRRNKEMNFGFPPGCKLSWKIRSTQTFSTADDAHKAEQKLLSDLKRQGYAIGKEFAVVPEKKIDTLFASVAGSSAFFIRV